MTTNTSAPIAERMTPRVQTVLGVMLALLGICWGLAVNLPQQYLLNTYPADWAMALYFAVEHGPTELFFIAAIVLLRRAAFAGGTYLALGWSRLPVLTLIGVVLSLPLIVLANALWQLLIRAVLAVPLAGSDTAFADWWLHDPLTFVTLGLIYCVIAPTVEEVLFRGILFQYLDRRWMDRTWGLLIAVLLSSFVFAACHVDLVGFGGAFALGICSAMLLRGGRSIWPCILLHASVNGIYILQSMGLLLR